MTTIHNVTAVDLGFNVAVITLANRVWPQGYDVSEADELDSLEKLTAHINERQRVTVWKGGSDHTIFGDEEVNWAFRAWHDWVHWRYQLPFTPEGEAAAANVQIAQLLKVYGPGPTVERWADMILTEVLGQVEEHAQTGEFPADQVEFFHKAAPRYKGMGAWLVRFLSEKVGRGMWEEVAAEHRGYGRVND